MSTNINNAFLTKTKPHEIIRKLVERRTYYLGVIRGAVLTKTLDEAVEWYDIPDDMWDSVVNKDGDLAKITNRDNFGEFISLSYRNMVKEEKEGESFAHYVRLSIGVYPSTGGRTFITVHGSYDLVDLFIQNEMDWLGKDYSYWDSTDKPEDVTNREWNKRRDDWDKIFDFYGTRVASMLTYTYNEQVADLGLSVVGALNPLEPIVEHVKIPSDTKRKRNAVFNELYSQIERGDDWSVSDFMTVHRRIMGEIDSGQHDELLNKVVLKPLTTSKWIEELIKQKNEKYENFKLSYPEKSDVEYKLDKFPDGQHQIVITDEWLERENEKVVIVSHMQNFDDIQSIICANQALIECGVEHVELYTPYFLGARSDRKFIEGTSNYLKTVISPVINSQNFKKVHVIDAHSDVLEGCINNFKGTSNLKLVKHFLAENPEVGVDNTIFVAPDAGASKKIYKLVQDLGIPFEVVVCGKTRNLSDGKIDKVVVPSIPSHKNLILVDDLCDGGRTFINVAQEIDNMRFYDAPKKFLIVTHGVFSKQFDELNKYFEAIYSTNSYNDVPTTIHGLDGKAHKTGVKQMDVYSAVEL